MVAIGNSAKPRCFKQSKNPLDNINITENLNMSLLLRTTRRLDFNCSAHPGSTGLKMINLIFV